MDGTSLDASSVLITGATGFLGRHCLNALTQRFGQVHAVAHRKPIVAADSVIKHEVNLLDPAAVDHLIDQTRPSHLLHLAWVNAHGTFWRSAENLRWLEASLHLVQKFTECGGQRLVTAGSCAEYRYDQGTCHEDRTPLAPDSFYGQCKQSMQSLIESYAREQQLSYAHSRIFHLYGPHENPLRFVPTVIRSLLHTSHSKCSDGHQIRDYLYVEDAADAHTQLLCSDYQGCVNIGSGLPVSLRQLASTIQSLVGRSANLIEFGRLPRRDNEPTVLLADTRRISREIGWVPHWDLNAGLFHTIQWWKDQEMQFTSPPPAPAAA